MLPYKKMAPFSMLMSTNKIMFSPIRLAVIKKA